MSNKRIRDMGNNIVLLLLLSLLLAACESIPESTLVHNAPASTMDSTIGSYHKNQDKELILVTMASHAHDRLSEGQSINQRNLPERYALFLKSLEAEFGLTRVADWPISSLGIRCFVFEHKQGQPDQDWLTKITQVDGVETVQALKIHQVAGTAYNDPYLEMQNGLLTLQASESHRWATGKGVKVAVIDTGLDTRHIELKDKTPITRDYVYKDEKRFREDIHGTAIAGVIAADANNASGMVGVAPDASIIAIKACWQEQQSYSAAYCNTYTLSKAINYAIAIGVDIINLSLAGPPDPLLERLIAQAIKSNIVVVGSVHPTLRNSFPTSVPGVIAVKDKPESQDPINNLYAPGQKILSTGPGNQYDFYTGSSISTAHVSGIIALMRERKPHISPNAAQTALRNSISKQGWVNACHSVSGLIGASGCTLAGLR